MGTLNKYLNAAAVEEALDKGVAAYSQAEENKTDISSVKKDLNELNASLNKYVYYDFVYTCNFKWKDNMGGGQITLFGDKKRTTGNVSPFTIELNGGGATVTIENELIISDAFPIKLSASGPAGSFIGGLVVLQDTNYQVVGFGTLMLDNNKLVLKTQGICENVANIRGYINTLCWYDETIIN